MSCVDNKHKYGLWEIKEGMACRTCKHCGIQEKFKTEDKDVYHQEIEKQKEANLFIRAFNNVDNHDEKIVGYLNVILDDYVNYLNDEDLILLIKKMDGLESSNEIDIQNSIHIKKLCYALKTSNLDDFFDNLEKFQEYNANYFATILNNNETNARHL